MITELEQALLVISLFSITFLILLPILYWILPAQARSAEG